MKFLRLEGGVVAALAIFVVPAAWAQDNDELPQKEGTTELVQAAPTEAIDLDAPDQPEASGRMPVPDAGEPAVETSAPAPAPSTRPTSTTASTSAAQEANQRQTQAVRARQAISEADVMRSNSQLNAAAERLEFALRNLYTTGASAADYQRAAYGLAAVRAEQAQIELQEGNWDEAVNLYEKAVSLDPANESYRQGLARARERQQEAIAASKRVDEVDNNPVITPEFVERVKIVQRLFYEYERFVDTGQYDKADDRLKRILALDPYNRAAYQLKRQLEKKKYKAADEFRDLTREQAMTAVTDKWTERVPPDYGLDDEDIVTQPGDISRLAQMEQKLQDIVIESVNFESIDIEQVIQFLEQKAFERDETGIEPRGVNFVLNLNTETGEGSPNITRTVPLNLRNVPLSEVLRFISTITNLQVKVEEYAVVLSPIGSREILDTRTYNVPPGFIPPNLVSTGADASGFTKAESVKTDVKQVLEGRGVSFSAPGSTAIFLGGVNKLVVKNTPAELDIIQALISNASKAEQPQVEIETKFAEFTDDSLKALYFQYYLSADTNISPTAALAGQNPFIDALAPFQFNPAALPVQVGTAKYSGQSALRTAETQNATSSAFAGVSPNSLDQLLRSNTPGSNLTTPVVGQTPVNFLTGQALGQNDFNTLAVGAVINGRGFAAVSQFIDNLQGVDVMAAPKVTTKNRNPATIEVVRELRYPSEFERPEINPESFGVTVFSNEDDFDFPSSLLLIEETFVVLPSTPREFEIKNIGVTLRVQPTTYPDQRIDLELEPEVVDFEGFVNWGSPINQISAQVRQGVDVPEGFVVGVQTLAEGVVNQPVFSVRQINTKLQVLDGQTVVMGGLIREDRQEINDKIPGLGDIPLLGRMFTSKIEKSVKRNLMMFVTARLVKSDGTPLYSQLLPEEEYEKMEISPDLTPMIVPPPPPQYRRVPRRDFDPKAMQDGKMMYSADNKSMESANMFEVDDSKTIEFEDDTYIFGEEASSGSK